MGSNMIVFEVDPLFSDFGRFVIMGFFVDPPGVGPVFPVEISQVITMLGTYQKTGDQQDENNDPRNQPVSSNQRFHDGTHPLTLCFILHFRHFYAELNSYSEALESDPATVSTIMATLSLPARAARQYI
jgi:hypothetical protein